MTARLAVVGAGITGLSVAWHALARGLRPVVVLDRAGVGAGASGVQPGGVRQQWGTPVNCLLARDSLRFYREARRRLDARVDPCFRACGYLFLAQAAVQRERLAAGVALQRSLGIPATLLEPADAAAIAPALDATAIAGAAFCAEDGYFDRPRSVVEAFAEAVVRSGGEITRGEVVELRSEGGGWSLGLRDGGRTVAEQVVVAAASESAQLLARLGIELPIVRETRTLFLSDPIRERLLEPLVVSPERRFAAKQLADGRVLASDLSPEGDAPADRESRRARVREAIDDLLPLLAFVSFPSLVAGDYDVTPDRQAVLGPLRGLDGLFVAAGFSGHGFMIAPEVGRGLAAMLAGEDPGAHFRDLAADRFERGALVLEPQVV